MPSIQHVSVAALCAMLALSSTVSGANLRAERRLGATYSSTTEWLQSMLDAVNSERSKNGLSSLCLNSKLTSAAQGHSEDMAANNYMDHDGADGSTMSSRVTAAGYDWSYVAENVAAGQTDVDSVMTSWMNSEGHRANILSSDITMFGAGYAYSDDSTYGHYWTQDFGASSVDECDGGSSSASTAATEAPVATTTAPTSSYDDEIQGEASSDAYTEAPATEAPATEAPATEAPATEAPVTEAPVTEAPATEAPGTVVPATEAPEAETPASNGGCKVRRQH